VKTNVKRKYRIMLFIGIIIILFAFFCSGFLGSAEISPQSVLDIVRLKLFGLSSYQIEDSEITIIWNLRMPRAILAIFIGGGLALSGVVMQSITQNILAEPYMVGVSSGALVFVTFGYFIGISIVNTWFGRAIMAFTGSILALIAVYKLSNAGRRIANSKLILTGMAVSTMLTALSNFFIIATPNTNVIKGILSWTMGSVASARWDNILFPCITIIICIIFILFRAKKYDVISLGDETALSLGVDVQTLKKQSIILISIMAGVAVASCGLIGFVGFIIPHIIRKVISPSHMYLLPLSFIYGGGFLCISDIMARTILSPQELPIGIITAFFGSPVFLYLLMKEKL
jgi:iron(III) dicitrate transport system permease protein fecD